MAIFLIKTGCVHGAILQFESLGVTKTVILNRIVTPMGDHKSLDHNCEIHSVAVMLHALGNANQSLNG
jgi:hypothetical protein